ncbi:hypothetical protein BGZ90_008373 [Linnemannia elongata]|nr:hypothetical protein BGZ90_008373 [Linnemannia elongata]
MTALPYLVHGVIGADNDDCTIMFKILDHMPEPQERMITSSRSFFGKALMAKKGYENYESSSYQKL